MSVRVLQGDCREVLRTLPAESVHCVVTSPPYFGLRSYLPDGHADKALEIGLEETPETFVAGLVKVFREVRRVLRPDGTLWLNLGDTYAGGGNGGGGSFAKDGIRAAPAGTDKNVAMRTGHRGVVGAMKAKDRMMIPARVALALQADGWWLRDEIVWHKPNPMPSSVADRCTPAHEMIYMLSRSARYWYDSDAIKEPSVSGHPSGNGFARPQQVARGGRGNTEQWQPVRPQAARAREIAAAKGLTDAHIAAIRAVGITDVGKAQVTQDGFGKNAAEVIALAAEAKAALGGYYREFLIAEMRMKRSVWSVPVMPFDDAHFATFPPSLIVDCIKAGCPVGGTVLDPFGGAGTTGLVAARLGRDAILIELDERSVAMAERRIAADRASPVERARIRHGHKPPNLGPLFSEVIGVASAGEVRRTETAGLGSRARDPEGVMP